jgi:hypothetical protein
MMLKYLCYCACNKILLPVKYISINKRIVENCHEYLYTYLYTGITAFPNAHIYISLLYLLKSCSIVMMSYGINGSLRVLLCKVCSHDLFHSTLYVVANVRILKFMVTQLQLFNPKQL